MPYFTIALIVVSALAGLWKIYEKCGKPGWTALIPIYNDIVLLDIVGRPLWWFLLFLIPFVNIIMGVIVWMDILKRFTRPLWHVALVILFPFIYLPYLGFSDLPANI